MDWFLKGMWSGGATIGELESWLKKAGYTKTVKGPGEQQTRGNLRLAGDYRGIGYRVILVVDHRVLSDGQRVPPPAGRPDHVVVLTSQVQFQMERGQECVTMTVFTWGKGKKRVPANGSMTTADFLKYYHGFVGAKY